MNSTFFSSLEALPAQLDDLDPVRLMVVASLIFAIWFLPTWIAIILRRPSLKFIIFSNCICLFSHLLWFGLLVWVISGKAANDKIQRLLAKRTTKNVN